MQALLPDLDLDPLPPSDEDPLPAARPPRHNFLLWIQIAGLVAGSWVFFVATMSGAPARFTWMGLLGHGLRYAFLTWAWSAGITFLLYLTVPAAERRDVAWNTLRVSSAAVWFAPAILLLSEWSPSTLAAGLVLTASATRMLYSQWRVTHPQPVFEPVTPPIESLFAGYCLPRRSFGRELAPALVSAALLQWGAVELGMERRLLSGALLVAGSSVLAIQAISRGAWSEQRPASLPRSFLGALFTILLAASLTVTGLRGRVVSGGLGGGTSAVGIRELLRQFMGKDQPQGLSDDAAQRAKKKGAGNTDTALPPPQFNPASQVAGGTFPGVILRPEVQPVVTLIAPLPAVKNGFPSATPAHPFSIPFAGEYWMWRWATFNRPPLNSYRQLGTPAEFSFRTVDDWPLQMEAHQKLIQPIDLACCAAVQIEIRNADPTPAAIQLELVAIGARGAEQSLGMARVLSLADLSKDPVVPVSETLEFAVPGHVSIGMMQEFKVIFRRVRPQAHRSAKIAIDRFLLVPR